MAERVTVNHLIMVRIHSCQPKFRNKYKHKLVILSEKE